MQLCVRLHRVAAEKARQERGRVQQHVLRIAVDDLAENLTPMREITADRPTRGNETGRSLSLTSHSLCCIDLTMKRSHFEKKKKAFEAPSLRRILHVACSAVEYSSSEIL